MPRKKATDDAPAAPTEPAIETSSDAVTVVVKKPAAAVATEPASITEESTASTPLINHTAKTITPPSEAAVGPVTAADKPADAIDSNAAEAPAESTPPSATSPASPEPQAQSSVTTSDTETTDADASPEAGVTRDSEAAAQAAAAEVDAAELARNQELEQLIASRKYAVPINAVQQKRNRLATLGLFLLALLLATLLFDILLDTHLVSLPFQVPHTQFFKSQAANAHSVIATTSSQTYTSPKDGLSFRYPASWKSFVYSSTSSGERVTLFTKATDSTASAMVFYRGEPDSSVMRNIETITYLPFTRSGRQLYIRQLIYSYQFGQSDPQYVVEASVSDVQGNERAGTTALSTASFKAKDGSPVFFQLISTGGGGSTHNLYYPDLRSAKAYFYSPTYKQAEAILESIKL